MVDVKLSEIAKAKKIKKPKPLKGIAEPRAIERQYHKLLKQLTGELKRDVMENIMPLLKTASIDSNIATDSVNDILTALAQLANKYMNISSFANSTSDIVVNGIEQSNKKRFFNSINNSIGVDLQDIITEEKLGDVVQLQKSKNVTLIKSIPQEFIKDIEVIVQNGLADGLRHEAIAKQIKGIKGIKSVFGKLDNRVKLIARNEVASINGSLTKKRAENLGVTKGIWRTAMDERVRPCHKARNGKEFDLSKGLYSSCDGKTLFPAISEINCRCYFESIIK